MTKFDIRPCNIVYNVYPIKEEYVQISRYLYCMEQAAIPIEMLITAAVYNICGMACPLYNSTLNSLMLSDQDRQILSDSFTLAMGLLSTAMGRYLPIHLRGMVAEVRVKTDVFGHHLVLGVLST
jgi:hypothetical protein